VDLDGFFALHPALASLVPLWENHALALVHACGSPDTTRSHFDAQDYMECGTPGSEHTRRLAGARAPHAFEEHEPLPRRRDGPHASANAPGRRRRDLDAVHRSLRRPGRRRHERATGFEALYEPGVRDLLHGTGRETFEAVKMLRNANASRISPRTAPSIARALRRGAAADRPAHQGQGRPRGRVRDMPGWDTHVAQGAERGQLALRFREFGGALAAFAQDLGDKMADVVVITMSEFGRTVAENGNRGTDHGHATAMLVLGGGVRGGRAYGRWPGLAPQQLFEGRDLAVTTDFRSLFTESRHAISAPPPRRSSPASRPRRPRSDSSPEPAHGLPPLRAARPVYRPRA